MTHHGAKAGNGWKNQADKFRAQFEAGQIRESVLHDMLAVERANTKTQKGYVETRDAAIKALEDERDVLKVLVAELQAELRIAYDCQPPVEAEKEHYRAALAEIEQVLHRLGDGCGFAHNHTDTEGTTP